jgi:16S rRNA (cytidine1402-2'-O)-methyltransferase
MALYIVPTPIGNLGDITARAIDVLGRVDFIIAEDTRHSRKLLNHLRLKKRMISHYRPKEESQAAKIVALLAKEDAALITDSGTPAISDPGHILVRRAVEAGIQIIPLPGPTAFVPALVASGIDPQRFLFLGFPPRRAGEQQRLLQALEPLPYTLVFYESPRRVQDFLRRSAAVLGGRPFAIAKELSKKHERIIRGRLPEWPAALLGEAVLGEMILIIAGSHGPARALEAPRLQCLEDIYAYFQERHGLRKNAIKRVLMKKRSQDPRGRADDR